ncbi:LexA family protein [Bacillus albus]|uniref:LexA family protein n=1 Tax=Bacillus albus TaxID=2026189 RepID=UPI00101F11BF|nr:XRE family transcriptional regulator [Bacillus albus]
MYGNKLRELRHIEGWTQEDVAKKIGVTKQTYSHYENEKRKPSLSTIRELANVYNVDIDAIFAEGLSDNSNKIPIIGSASCKDGSVVFKHIEGYEDTPKSWLKDGEYFYLRAKGDSMNNARIYEGDLLFIRKQDQVETGEIAAVCIDNEVVLKRIFKNKGALILQSENTTHPPLILDPNDLHVKIIGLLKKVVINF